ncbi:methyltransferase, TIGR00027 family [Nocardia nova SH22a]|uniref:S-adenosyl-L-methionine-dependent methyltransferase n=2 Tax=Nocardia nova TaxID=37330 RepID=W5TDA9_9NOCA|nr:methyltransferase, TIGR00027 family [Nocardia nova SH22a]
MDKPASWTAIRVCQGRAVADRRFAVGQFSDPIAAQLLRGSERTLVDHTLAAAAPSEWRNRLEYEMLTATAAVMAARTVVIDNAVDERGNQQLAILGAGLDARAWRMASLSEVDVFEIDHPASQQDKRNRIGTLQSVAKSVTYVPVDFGRDSLGPALAAAGHTDTLPTTWIWEGVMPYLTQAQVQTTLAAVAERSAIGSRLIATYPVPNRFARARHLTITLFSWFSTGRERRATEPQRSAWTPNIMHDLLAAHGFTVTADHELAAVAEQLAIPVHRSRFSDLGRVAVADRLED